jgi:hypothetical protein
MVLYSHSNSNMWEAILWISLKSLVYTNFFKNFQMKIQPDYILKIKDGLQVNLAPIVLE